ncbi:MAG: hypothetical protein WCI30_00640 [Clostridia bacterium]
MEYRFYSAAKNTNYITERHSKSGIAYASIEQFQELFPRGGYEIIGDIGNFQKKVFAQDFILTDTGNRIPIFPRGSIRKPFEWIVGYAAVGEKTFVAVVKSIIPSFFKG